MLFLSCFIWNCHGSLILSQILNLFIDAIFEHNNFATDKEIHYFRFSILNNKYIYQVPVITQRNHLNVEHCRRLTGRCDLDLDSDINFLASSNLWQCTTVTSQCERLPWTWTWRLLYCNCWYHFDKRSGSV